MESDGLTNEEAGLELKEHKNIPRREKSYIFVMISVGHFYEKKQNLS